jgi:hypothetical protein
VSRQPIIQPACCAPVAQRSKCGAIVLDPIGSVTGTE